MKNALLMLIGLLMFMTVVSCPLVDEDFVDIELEPPDSDSGTLVIDLQSRLHSAKTLAPQIELVADSYDIRGTGPDPQVDHFEYLGVTETTLIHSGLIPGTWTVSVEVRNANVDGDPTRNGTIIGYGETDPPITVVAGSTVTAHIDIHLLSGAGELELIVSWTKKIIPNPSIAATLTHAGSGTSETLDFDLTPKGNPDTGTYYNPAIPAGYYLLVIKFLGDGEPLWGTAEAVWIVTGVKTSHTYTPN